MSSYVITTQSPSNGSIEDSTEAGRNQTEAALMDVVNKLNTVILVSIMFGLGCSVDLKQIFGFLKRPKEFITGICMQLLVMPLLGLAITQMLGLTVPETLGVFIQSIAPGGVYSNLVAYWLDGDMDLSVIMTTTSNILSLGSMPLWLFIISNILKLDQHLLIPYVSVVTGLAMSTGPLICGIIFQHFLPKISPLMTKIGTIVGSTTLPVVYLLHGLAGSYNFPLSYKLFLSFHQNSLCPEESIVSHVVDSHWGTPTWETKTGAWISIAVSALCLLIIVWAITYYATFLINAAAIMITAALSFGYAASRLPCINLKSSCRRTIAIETAYQSVPVAFSIIVLSFRHTAPEIFQPMSFFPMLYGLVILGCSAIVIIVYSILKSKGVKCFLPDDDLHKAEPAEESDTMDALMKV